MTRSGVLSAVRKHRAPKGALRRFFAPVQRNLENCVRKDRAPKGALRHLLRPDDGDDLVGQKAPSAKRRIKTPRQERTAECARVHRQKAPSAKRCIKTDSTLSTSASSYTCQEAPSAKRCIKTDARAAGVIFGLNSVRKHRAPKGALRRGTLEVCGLLVVAESERTERQKVN